MGLDKQQSIELYEANIKELEEKLKNNPNMDCIEKKKIKYRINEYKEAIKNLS
jgi:hypothetical protein